MKVRVRGTVDVPLSLLSADELAEIEKTLTFRSRNDDSVVAAYRLTEDTITLPKFYVIRKLMRTVQPHISNEEIREPKKTWRFAGALRPHQVNPTGKCVATTELAPLILKNRGVFASAPCGSGKTVSALYVIHTLGLSTIVVVPTETLLRQWCRQLATFLPDVKVTVYAGARKDLTGDVVVASLKTLALHPVERKFSLFVLDEAHMAATALFSQAMYNVNFRYSLAMTATGDRFDGMDPLFRWPLAMVTVTLDTDQLPVVVRYLPYTHANTQNHPTNPLNIDMALAYDVQRNTCLVQYLLRAHDRQRRILVLSKSVVQLRMLREVFSAMRPGAKTAILSNDPTIRGEKLETTRRTRQQVLQDEKYLTDPDAVVFATIGKAGVGYDDPNKDYLLLALPMMDPRQIIGRVQRRLPGKSKPEVEVLVDNLASVRGRMIAAYRYALRPLGDRCILENECSWLPLKGKQ